MKKILLIITVGILLITAQSCEKEKPAEDISGNYSGVMKGSLGGVDTLMTNYTVAVEAISKNKVSVNGNTFPKFELLVTKEGINVKPVSTDDEVAAFLYQGDLDELSFKYYKNGDTSIYTGYGQ